MKKCKVKEGQREEGMEKRREAGKEEEREERWGGKEERERGRERGKRDIVPAGSFTSALAAVQISEPINFSLWLTMI